MAAGASSLNGAGNLILISQPLLISLNCQSMRSYRLLFDSKGLFACFPLSTAVGDMPSIEQLIAGNMEHRITQPAESSGDSKESVLILVRNWFAIALRRRSTDLLG